MYKTNTIIVLKNALYPIATFCPDSTSYMRKHVRITVLLLVPVVPKTDLRKLLTYLLMSFTLGGVAQVSHTTDAHVHEQWGAKFQENKGQWPSQVTFKCNIPYGALYMEKQGLVFVSMREADLNMLHDAKHGHQKLPDPFLIHGHAHRISFDGGNQNPEISTARHFPDYVNYFIGNDRSKWAGNVQQYGEVTYRSVYPGINFKMYQNEYTLKYDFIVAPNADPSKIKMKYEGVEGLKIKQGFLKIQTSVNEIIEQKPVAYQIVNGQRVIVPCKFKLDNNTISFAFPKGYDESLELVIDPVLIFSSYTGSPTDNWGYTATYDDLGNLYAGGASFGINYPTTLGAFQSAWGGGSGTLQTDIAITVFNNTGTGLIYSTYLGGASNDNPHSLVVNANQQLYVLGSTSSNNFPTTPGCIDGTFNGGPSSSGEIISYPNGADITVTKFNPSGTALIGSTYMGGSDIDGINNATGTDYNYGDAYRGEIIVDANDRCYVASCSRSTDVPVSIGAPQGIHGGGQDGLVFRLNSTLTVVDWCTYLGGSGNDAAYGVQLDGTGNVFVSGGTGSANFPTTPGSYSGILAGGLDGFISKINPAGNTLIASTFVGSNQYDQNYFVQIDNLNNVWVVGQTEGPTAVFPGTVYSNPNSGQYLLKLDNALANVLVSTQLGTGNGTVDISISAFLVNQCDHIYIAGWGGNVNRSNNGPASSTTIGLPITPNAFKSTTNGSDFYLMVLNKDADSLLYATFFGGTNNDHVDGGTSRFDKKGIVYQAVCAGCGGNSSFPSTPGAYSTTNQATNCNLAAMKFDLSQLTADVGFTAAPYYCAPATINFLNSSNGGTSYLWNFGDGNTSTQFQPTHTYTTGGTYNVSLIVTDSLSCTKTDTAFITILVYDPPVAAVNPDGWICPGATMQLSATGGASYQWTPTAGLSNPNIANPIASPAATTTYKVVVTDSCGVDSAFVTVNVHTDPTTVSNDTAVCRGNQVLLQAGGAQTYNWAPPIYLNNPALATPLCTPITTTAYTVTMTDANGCVWTKPVTVYVDTVVPSPIAGPDTTICFGDSITLTVSDGRWWQWFPAVNMDDPKSGTPKVWPPTSTQYQVIAANGCGNGTDVMTVNVNQVIVTTPDSMAVCIGYSTELTATAPGAASYYWTPEQYLDDPNIQSPTATPPTPMYFNVTVTDTIGCVGTGNIFVDTLPRPPLDAGPDIALNWRQDWMLNVLTTADSIRWSPPTFLSCTNCKSPDLLAPDSSITYIVRVADKLGCVNYDTITIFIKGSLYVPNTFTPGGDGKNEFFFAFGKEIAEFEMTIFDRWGELIFTSNDLKTGWDGTYKGKDCKTDTYVWKIKYRELIGQEYTVIGHVNLLR